jgi:hypothetical protein
VSSVPDSTLKEIFDVTNHLARAQRPVTSEEWFVAGFRLAERHLGTKKQEKKSVWQAIRDRIRHRG